MNQTPPRWLQRLANYRLAYQQLTNAVTLTGQRPLSDLEQQGLIQAFEYTHELAWHVMKDYFVWQGAHQYHRLARCHAGGIPARAGKRWRRLDGNDQQPQPNIAHL